MKKNIFFVILCLVTLMGCTSRKKSNFDVEFSPQVKDGNKILTNVDFIDKIICMGEDFLTINLNKNIIKDYYGKIPLKDEFIGYYSGFYIFNDIQKKIIIKRISEEQENEAMLDEIDFLSPDWIKVKNDSIYFANESNIDIYKITNNYSLKKINNFFIGESTQDAQLFDNKYLIYLTKSRKIIIKNLTTDENQIIAKEIFSFIIYGDNVIYNNKDNLIFAYNPINKRMEKLNYQIDYNYDKKIINPVELIEYYKDKLFYITHHFGLSIQPTIIIHYYDFKNCKVVNIVEFSGLYSTYKIFYKL